MVWRSAIKTRQNGLFAGTGTAREQQEADLGIGRGLSRTRLRAEMAGVTRTMALTRNGALTDEHSGCYLVCCLVG